MTSVALEFEGRLPLVALEHPLAAIGPEAHTLQLDRIERASWQHSWDLLGLREGRPPTFPPNRRPIGSEMPGRIEHRRP